jgi:citrate lyase beta subunit
MKSGSTAPAPPESRRQPVHTVYGGAHLWKADSTPMLGALAMRALLEHAATPRDLAEAIDLDIPIGVAPEAYIATIHARVGEKLKREAIEDFRIDFEDGYGHRPDQEEDAHARQAAAETARGLAAGTLPPFLGIRIKPLSPELTRRSLRTLELFVTTLVKATKGTLAPHFVVTLPKVKRPAEVTALVKALAALERKQGLPAGSLQIELMVETTESIFDARGGVALPALVAAAKGRCRGAHFGTYDYTAACEITAAHQTMTHPACDFAKNVMQVALAGTGVMLSDGATNVMPIGARETVHRAWRLHYGHVRHSLRQGFYQGWDLHPAQLPTRYAAVYSFFLEGLEPASARLRNFMGKAAQATLVGDVFDDAATGQGLLNFFLRGLACGAITADEAERTGLTLDELQTRSFLKILEGRRRT